MNRVVEAWVRAVRFGFRLLYNEMAWSYDMVSWLVSLGEWQKWVQVPLRYLDGGSPQTILELGHGPGHLLAEMRKAGHKAVGFDLSSFMGRQAARRLRSEGVDPRLVRGTVQVLPFAPARFDWVIATFPTDYIIDPKTIREVRRVLRQNGRFLIVPEGHLAGSGPLRGAIDWLFRITGQRSGAWDDSDQQRMWGRFIERFEAAGFDVQLETVMFPKSAVTVIVARRC